MVSVIEELRQNDPARTRFIIVLRRETSDADLAQALEQNPFVNAIELDVNGVQQADWNSLLRVIATRANLENMTLQNSLTLYTAESARAALAALVGSILRAMQQNTAIRTVELDRLRLSTDISTFVDNASSISSLRLKNFVGEQGARDLAAALQRNTNIQSLQLSRFSVLRAIGILLEGLRSSVSLKTLIFHSMYSDATSHALQHLLESTTSIQKFELGYATLTEERQFPLIAQAITSSQCISELKFLSCHFHEENSCAQLQSILQNKHNLTSLCLGACEFRRWGQFPEDIISVALRPGSQLRCFEFWDGSIFSDVQLKNLLQAVEKSKLERFQIGNIATPHELQILIQSIPSMKLKELEIDVWIDEYNDEDEPVLNSSEAIRQDLLHAVKNNLSLRSLKANEQLSETDVFDDDDKQTLAFYANRNESLDEWVDNPETVEQRKVWPEALSLAERAGPNALFCGLRSVLERDYVNLPDSRKRKRPQY